MSLVSRALVEDLLVKGLILLGWPLLMVVFSRIGRIVGSSVSSSQNAGVFGLFAGVLVATVVAHLLIEGVKSWSKTLTVS